MRIKGHMYIWNSIALLSGILRILDLSSHLYLNRDSHNFTPYTSCIIFAYFKYVCVLYYFFILFDDLIPFSNILFTNKFIKILYNDPGL